MMSVDLDDSIVDDMLELSRLMLLSGKSLTVVNNPYVIILGGQPGSGKSTCIQEIEQEQRFKGNIIAICNDDVKPFFPNYVKLLTNAPDKTSNIVQPYANVVVNKLREEFSDKKYNLIIEGTMRTSETPLNTIRTLNAKGYKSEAYLISANYYTSRVGCLNRREREILKTGHGRSVPIEKHDEAYNNIPHTLDALIKSDELADIKILDRRNNLIGSLSKGDNLTLIYKDDRVKFNKDDYNTLSSLLNEMLLRMITRNATSDEISQAQLLLRDLQEKYQ